MSHIKNFLHKILVEFNLPKFKNEILHLMPQNALMSQQNFQTNPLE